jgi:DivIVA domain-containing protein
VPLDRKDIERKDFPTARRGYAPDAVDTHLRALAEEVETLKKEASAKPARPESVASGASEQVRAIVEAAESSASQIKEQAEREARSLRDEAAAQGRQHVARVSKASQALIERVEAMDAEVKRLSEGLVAQLGTPAAKAAPAAAAATTPAAAPEDDDAADHAVDAAAGGEPSEPPPADEPEPVAAEEAQEAQPSPSATDDDSEGARLIALNMALNGTPRDETDRYLSENFELVDRGGLLDEVYARVGT